MDTMNKTTQERIDNIITIMDRLDKNLLLVPTLKHTTMQDIDAKVAALSEVYYSMLVQQSKMRLIHADKGIVLDAYYNNIE